MSSAYDKRLDGDPIDRLAMKIDPDCPIEWTVLDLRAAAKALVRLNRENRALRDRCTAPEAVGDSDNFAKAILDALHDVAFVNDAQVTDLIVRKRYAAAGFAPGAKVWIRPLETSEGLFSG